eukprot:scaffold12063_cov68-Phaeocystis_antarctica.AAC.2
MARDVLERGGRALDGRLHGRLRLLACSTRLAPGRAAAVERPLRELQRGAVAAPAAVDLAQRRQEPAAAVLRRLGHEREPQLCRVRPLDRHPLPRIGRVLPHAQDRGRAAAVLHQWLQARVLCNFCKHTLHLVESHVAHHGRDAAQE